MRTLLVVIGIVLAGPAFGAMIGMFALGPGGVTIGSFAGLAAGFYLMARYLADMRAIAVARRNAEKLSKRHETHNENIVVGQSSVRAYLRSPSWRAASLRRLVNDPQLKRDFDPNVEQYHNRLSDMDKRQAYDLQMPSGTRKRKGKPKRQRWS